MNRIKTIATTLALTATPLVIFAEDTAPDLSTVANGAKGLFFSAAAVGVAIMVYRLGKKALSKGI